MVNVLDVDGEPEQKETTVEGMAHLLYATSSFFLHVSHKYIASSSVSFLAHGPRSKPDNDIARSILDSQPCP